jgi:hypothetical protein
VVDGNPSSYRAQLSARPFALTKTIEVVRMVSGFVHHTMQRFCAEQ